MKGIIEACKILKYPDFQKSTEITLKLCSRCHVLFGFKCFPKLKEHCLVTILLTILSVCVN